MRKLMHTTQRIKQGKAATFGALLPPECQNAFLNTRCKQTQQQEQNTACVLQLPSRRPPLRQWHCRQQPEMQVVDASCCRPAAKQTTESTEEAP
jgi:hypothetical protein